MKQIAQYQDGRLELKEVAVPEPPPGGILVRTTHSVISIGTEKMKVEQARMSLIQLPPRNAQWGHAQTLE